MKKATSARLLALATAATLGAAANAAPIDVTSAVASIGEALAPAVTVGMAIIGVLAGVFAIKLVRRML